MTLLCICSPGAASIPPAPASSQGPSHDCLWAKCPLGTASARHHAIPSASRDGLPALPPDRGAQLPLAQGAQGPHGKPGAAAGTPGCAPGGGRSLRVLPCWDTLSLAAQGGRGESLSPSEERSQGKNKVHWLITLLQVMAFRSNFFFKK